MHPKIHIGTSGWYYEHWNENFYPEDVKSNERLPYYAQHFKTVEINTTFYHLPKETTIDKWIKDVPKNFVFSVKASQYITHRKRLKDAKESTELFFQRIAPLGKHLGPILFQLSPSFKMNFERLETFIQHLPSKYQYVFEFRHSSWFVDDIYHILKRNKIGLCITDLGGKISPEEVTADFVYIRLHGPQHVYRGSYGPARLKTWLKKILNWEKEKKSVYCYFDNDEKGYAIQDAKTIQEFLHNNH